MKNSKIIKSNHEFQDIISKSEVLKSKSFLINFRSNKEKKFKYGISVGKKLGNAVFRNKIKRQTRNMVYELLNNDFDSNNEMIIVIRKIYPNFSYNDNLNQLKKLFERLRGK